MPATKEQIEQTLSHAFPNAKVEINDLAGDNEHWAVTLTDDCFKGQTRITQHKSVFKALAPLNIHALQIKTLCG